MAYDEGHTVKLVAKLFLADGINDLPAVRLAVWLILTKQ